MPLTRKVDIHRYGSTNNTPSINTPNLDPISYNDRYPGLDEYNYKKLESKIDKLGLTGYDREKAMDEAYLQVLPIVQNQIKMSDRGKFINQSKYEASQIQDPDARIQANAKTSSVELTQLIKEKYNIDPSANDEEMLKSWIKTIPNGDKLLADYINGDSKELLYKSGLEKRPEDARQKLKDNFWDSLWDNVKTKASVPVDSMKKRGQRTLNEVGSEIYKNILKKVVGDEMGDKLGINFDDYVDTFSENAINPMVQENILDYQNKINENYRTREQENLDQDIKNYYDNKGYTKLLSEGDFKGFLYKSMGDAAQNWEMPVVIAASVFQPEIGLTLMATDSYARENQEAFENMLDNGATYEQAEQGAVVVGLINAAVEVTLDKLLGGLETTASNEIRKILTKNIQEEAVKKGLGKILLEGAKTQLKSSAEEGLEELVQQIVQNAAVRTVNENQKLFEGVGSAFEGGFYNPMNLLAGGSNVNQNIKTNKSEVRQSIMDGAKNLAEATNNMVDSAKETIDTTKEAISEKADNTKGKVANLVNATYGIDETLKKNIQDNPYSAQIWEKTKEWIDKNGRPEKSNEVASALIDDVVERVQESLSNKMDEGSDTGKLYKPLLDAGYSVDISELKDSIDGILQEKYGIKIQEIEGEDGKTKKVLDFSKTAIDGSEANNIKKIYNWIQDTNKPMSLEEYKNRFRRTLSDMVDFNQVGRDQYGRKTADTQGDKVLKEIRTFANDLAHNQIPELAAVDEKFNEWVQIMDDVSDGLVYKDKSKRGVIRDNITQIISNLDNKNRRQIANRLEKIMPGITEEVRAINNMPKLVEHYYKPSKWQERITSGAGAIIGTSLGGPLGGAIGIGAGYGLSKRIDKLKSSKWDKIISETSKEGKTKLNDIQERIKKNEKISQDQKTFLENISKKLKEGKANKEAEVAQIIADVSSAEGDVVSVLTNAIQRLETLGAKAEAKEIRGWLDEVQKAMKEKAEMDRQEQEFETEKQQIIEESSDQMLPEFKKRIYKLQEEEKRIGSVAGKKIGKTFEGKDYKNQQETEWLRKKDKLIEEIGEYYNVDQQEASEIYDRIERTVSMDDLNRKKTRTKEDITKEYQDKAREKFGIDGDSVPYELTQTDEYKALENDYRNELENADSIEDIATKLNNDINNMEVGDKIRVLEDFEGEEIETTIEKRKNGYAIYHDGVRDFIYNDQISPDGFLGKMNIVSYEKI